jgi:hypothetical protein
MHVSQKILLSGIMLLGMFSCSHKQTAGSKVAGKSVVKYIDGYQELSVNNLTKDGRFLDTIKVLNSASDSLDMGKGYNINVFLSNSDVKIAYAYLKADINEKSLVDTTSGTVNISRGVVFRIKNDTVQVNFTVSEFQPGPKEYGVITVISVDKEKVYRYHNGSIRYISRKP